MSDPAMTLADLGVPYRLEIEGGVVFEKLPSDTSLRARKGTDRYFLARYWSMKTGEAGIEPGNVVRPDFVDKARADLSRMVEGATLGELEFTSGRPGSQREAKKEAVREKTGKASGQ